MANIVSAFNAITEFSFNDKLECGCNQKGNFGEINAHDKEWKVIKVSIKAELTTMILGVPVDLTNKWNKLKQYIRGKIAALSVPIAKKNVSFATKTAAYLMAPLPAIIYPAKFLNISIIEHERLFQPLDRFLRQITEVKTSFPCNLLYIRQNEG